MATFNLSEALRYMGYKTSEEATEEQKQKLNEVYEELAKVAHCRYHAVRLAIVLNTGDYVAFENGFVLNSKDLATKLEACDEAILFCATLGSEIDRELMQAAARGVEKQVMVQAVAASMLESYCDELETELLTKEDIDAGLCLLPRFSPGYGDLSIQVQPEFLRQVDAARRVGVTLTDGLVMTPTKSVSAVVGVAYKPGANPLEHHDCSCCSLHNCAFRKDK